jgi:hypothetical protein
MPTRADWEAAAPKCPQRVARDRSGRMAAGAASTLCYEVLRYDIAKHMWTCPNHGHVLAGVLFAAQRAAAETGYEAA